jgi:hypothetical protein
MAKIKLYLLKLKIDFKRISYGLALSVLQNFHYI